MERGFSMLALAVVAIILAVVVATALFIVRGGKFQFSQAIAEVNGLTADYDNPGLQMYDGSIITGEDVISTIDSYASSSLIVTVKTLKSSSGYPFRDDYANDLSPTRVVINNRGNFKGRLIRDANGSIKAILFTQIRR